MSFAKKHKGEVEMMEADSSSAATTSAKAGGLSGSNNASSGAGYRGSLTGDTELNKGYSTYYHEYHPCHSRKVKQYSLWWNLWRNIQVPDVLKEGELPIRPLQQLINGVYGTAFTDCTGLWGYTAPAAGATYSGNDVCYVQNPYFRDYAADKRHYRRDPANMVRVIGLDFKVEDLIDNKLYDFNVTDANSKGIFSLYKKFRLESFTIEICPKSYQQSALDANPTILANVHTKAGSQSTQQCPLWWPACQGEYKYNSGDPAELQTTISSVQQLNLGDQYQCKEVDMDYWVYRDVYNEFGNETTSDLEVNLQLNCTDIRNYDNNMSIMSNKEPFKFTRKVNTKANYFVPYTQLANLQNQNINIFINTLEGISGTDATVQPLIEGFNYLMVPCNPQFQSFCAAAPRNPGEGDANFDGFCNLLIPRLHTKVYVKITAKWEAFDYRFDQGAPGQASRMIESASIMKEINLRELDRFSQAQRLNLLNK